VERQVHKARSLPTHRMDVSPSLPHLAGNHTHAWCSYSPPKGAMTNLKIPELIARDQGKTYSSACLAPSQSPSSSCTIYGVPYSEHSSFFELTCFALSTDWVKMIATVNVGNEASRTKMKHWFDHWAAERKRRNGEPVPHRTIDYW
jgi:DNA cross-link repair 1A protein